jgi:linearmycin/streptolysin S transport system permease protein
MPFWEIAKKDLLLVGRDARGLFTLIAFPLIFITIIGLTTGKLLGWKNENQVLKIAVVDRVNYAAIADPVERRKAVNIQHKLINSLRGNGRRAELLQPDADVKAVDADGKWDAVLVIGPQFHNRVEGLEPESLLSGDSPLQKQGTSALDVELLSHLSQDSGTRSIIEELVRENTLKTVLPYVLCRLRTSNMVVNRKISAKCETLDTEDVALKPAAQPAETEASGEGRVYQEVIPSYTVMFVFFLVNTMGRSFLQERELGTLRRLRIAPVTGPGLLAGKTLPFFLISIAQTVVLFLAGRLLFDMSWGPEPWMLLPVIAATSLAATGLGLVVATLVRTDAQVSSYANIVVISMAGISGCFMPRNWLPPQMLKISLGTPHAWALMSYEQLLRRKVPDLAEVWQNSGVLTVFAVAFFAFGCWRFRSYE